MEQAFRLALQTDHLILPHASWSRLEWVVRERPVTAVVMDGAALPRRDPAGAVLSILTRFPSLVTLLVARERMDRTLLFRLGRAGLANLVLLEVDRLARDLPRALRSGLQHGTEASVVRVVSPYLPRRELNAVRLAIQGVGRGWSTEDLAHATGLSRPHLSVRLRSCGLPSAGRLLTWSRLFHAGRWIVDPGRTAESISRQLDYTDGAAFRRALRGYVGLTPTRLRAGGGLRPVLERFLEACDLPVHPRALRSVA